MPILHVPSSLAVSYILVVVIVYKICMLFDYSAIKESISIHINSELSRESKQLFVYSYLASYLLDFKQNTISYKVTMHSNDGLCCV